MPITFYRDRELMEMEHLVAMAAARVARGEQQ